MVVVIEAVEAVVQEVDTVEVEEDMEVTRAMWQHPPLQILGTSHPLVANESPAHLLPALC